MKKGGTGGANTRTGLAFESKVDLVDFLKRKAGYAVKAIHYGDSANGTENVFEVLYKGETKAHLFKKHGFYKFLAAKGVDWRKHIARQLVPDSGVYVIADETLFIIEMKTQHTEGTVDEKLQTCGFKLRQYRRLVSELGLKVEYRYLLSDWFRQDKYRDVLEYIRETGCDYCFLPIDLGKLGLAFS